jgi:hypothetical protein
LNHNDFYDRSRSPALALRHQGNRNGAKLAEFPRNREQSALDTSSLSHELKRLSAGDPLSPPPPEFDREEVLVCMLLAFCVAGASTGLVYRLLA